MFNLLEVQPGTGSVIDFSKLDFGAVSATVLAGIAAVAGIAITLIAARKGWAFIKSQISRA